MGGNNIINNHGFESDKTNWRFYSNASGNNFSVVSSDSVEGSKKAMVTFSASGSNMQLNQSSVGVKPSTRYKLSFWAKSNTAHDLAVRVHKHGYPYTNYGLSKSYDLTSSWKKFTTEFTSTSSATSDARLRFWFVNNAKANDVYHIDDVVLEEI